MLYKLPCHICDKDLHKASRGSDLRTAYDPANLRHDEDSATSGDRPPSYTSESSGGATTAAIMAPVLTRLPERVKRLATIEGGLSGSSNPSWVQDALVKSG